MKIAAVTDDEKTISAHFGRATKYVVLTVEDGRVTAREVREKASHRDFQREGLGGRHEGHESRGRGFGRHAGEKHRRMFAAIEDCQVVLARGMGQGAHQGLETMGIRTILTEIETIDQAVEAFLAGAIVDRPDRLH